MIPILFTFIALDWFTNNNKKEVNNVIKNDNDNQFSFSGMKYQDYKITDNLIKIKLQIEESNIIKSTAYIDDGGTPTIGIGIVSIYNNNLKLVRTTKKGDTLVSISKEIGLGLSDNRSIAYQLVRNYFNANVKNGNLIKVYKDLDNLNIPYFEELAEALSDFYFNSGSAYSTNSYKQFLIDVQSAKNIGSVIQRKQILANSYWKYRLSYLQSWSAIIYGSWLRRTQIFSDRINGDLTMDNIKSWKLYNTSSKVDIYTKGKYQYKRTKPLK